MFNFYPPGIGFKRPGNNHWHKIYSFMSPCCFMPNTNSTLDVGYFGYFILDLVGFYQILIIFESTIIQVTTVFFGNNIFLYFIIYVLKSIKNMLSTALYNSKSTGTICSCTSFTDNYSYLEKTSLVRICLKSEERNLEEKASKLNIKILNFGCWSYFDPLISEIW